MAPQICYRDSNPLQLPSPRLWPERGVGVGLGGEVEGGGGAKTDPTYGNVSCSLAVWLRVACTQVFAGRKKEGPRW